VEPAGHCREEDHAGTTCTGPAWIDGDVSIPVRELDGSWLVHRKRDLDQDLSLRFELPVSRET
jgi:hypothetical protein